VAWHRKPGGRVDDGGVTFGRRGDVKVGK